MREVDDGVAVVRRDGVVEHHRADPPPVPKRPAHAERRSRCHPVVGDIDRERERPLRYRIAPIEDLRHHLVADVEVCAGNHRLPGCDEQPDELGRSRRLAGWFPQLRNRIELTDGGLLVHAPEYRRDLDQYRPGGTAAEHGHVRRVQQFGGVDRLGSRAADVLLRDEVRGPQRCGLIRVHGWKQLADQRHRSDPTAPQAARPARIACDHERSTAAREVP